MDRLYFGGLGMVYSVLRMLIVSVSSDGSFVFWGDPVATPSVPVSLTFQYPLMDRLYFGGCTALFCEAQT